MPPFDHKTDLYKKARIKNCHRLWQNLRQGKNYNRLLQNLLLVELMNLIPPDAMLTDEAKHDYTNRLDDFAEDAEDAIYLTKFY